MNLPFECADTAKKERALYYLSLYKSIESEYSWEKKHNENTFTVQMCQM